MVGFAHCYIYLLSVGDFPIKYDDKVFDPILPDNINIKNLK